MSKTVLFQTIQFSIITQFQCQKQFNFKEFSLSLSTLFSFIRLIDRTLSVANTSGQSGHGSEGNEGILHLSHYPKLQQYWNLTISLCSVISRKLIGRGAVLAHCRETVDIFYCPCKLIKTGHGGIKI